jgi:hypothetical protein
VAVITVAKVTYLLIGVLRAINSDYLSCSLVSLVAVLNELLLEASIVFNVRWLIDSTLNSSGC